MADADFEAAAAELGRQLDARLGAYLGAIRGQVHSAMCDVLRADEFRLSAARIADQVWFKTDWIYENQDPSIPDDKKARDTAARSVQAGNGALFNPIAGLGALAAKLDKLPELIDAAVAKAVAEAVAKAVPAK